MSQPGTTTIYALADPRDDQVCYVGQTIRLGRRFTEHRSQDSTCNLRLRLWIEELAQAGEIPRPVVLEQCELERADERERYWIRVHLAKGLPLLNAALLRVRSSVKRKHRGTKYIW